LEGLLSAWAYGSRPMAGPCAWFAVPSLRPYAHGPS